MAGQFREREARQPGQQIARRPHLAEPAAQVAGVVVGHPPRRLPRPDIYGEGQAALAREAGQVGGGVLRRDPGAGDGAAEIAVLVGELVDAVRAEAHQPLEPPCAQDRRRLLGARAPEVLVPRAPRRVAAAALRSAERGGVHPGVTEDGPQRAERRAGPRVVAAHATRPHEHLAGLPLAEDGQAGPVVRRAVLGLAPGVAPTLDAAIDLGERRGKDGRVEHPLAAEVEDHVERRDAHRAT